MADERWHAAAAPYLPERPFRACRVEAFWNSFSCDPSIAVLQSVPAFLLSQASVGPRSSGEVARQYASALQMNREKSYWARDPRGICHRHRT